MIKFYLSVLSFFFCSLSFAQTVNTIVVNNGRWKLDATWSQNRPPQNGDIVEVPQGMTVLLNDNISMIAEDITIKVYGTIEMKTGKLDLGANSVIKIYQDGHISSFLSNNSDQIKIGGVTKYTGSEGTLSGPLVASKLTGTSPNGFMLTEPAVLPVQFTGFNLSRKANEIIAQWSTAQEINAAAFEVQRSLTGTAWMTLASVAANGNTNEVMHYSYTDKTAPNVTAYYRIKQVDVDGKATFTPVKTVKPLAAAAEIAITAAPNKIAIHFSQQLKGQVAVQVVSLSGQVVSSQVVSNPIGQITFSTAASLKGAYVVVVKNAGTYTARQVVL